MEIIEINTLDNGAHRNQSGFPVQSPPDGWAELPPSVGTAKTLENFPFGEITVGYSGQWPVVTGWAPLPMPEEEQLDPSFGEVDKVAALEAENTKLKAQATLQAEQLTMLEDCILELGDTVYA
jgi:hypothetical protein